MTSTDIVDETAAVVERLRAHAQYLRENLPTTSEQHLPEKKARISNLEGAADLIERLSRERLPVCCVTGRVAGDGFACGDCDPCFAAINVPNAVKDLISERDEFASKYEDAMLSRERDTGVPEGFWLAPIRPTDEIMTAAAEAHFGKRRTAQSGGIDGIGMTVDGRDLSFRDAFKSFWKGARSAAPQPPTVSTQGWQDGALKDIGIERLRQMSVEGWTPEHDDTHDQFEMARAAAFYCVTTYAETLPEPTPDEPSNRYSAFHTADCAWPSTWDGCWRKPKDARRNLVRAAALIVAEIERLDRANGAPPAQVQPDLSTLTRERDQLKEELERAYKVDDVKTLEINILTRENRNLYERLASSPPAPEQKD